MGIDFAIDVEPRSPPDLAISDEEIEAHYRATVPAGGPPLVEIREHVVRAIAVQRASTQIDPLVALKRRFADEFGRDRLWWDADLEAIARSQGVTLLRDFQRDNDGDLPEDDDPEWRAARMAERGQQILDRGPARNRWCDPAEGLQTIRALRAARDASALALIEEILVIAEREHRRWRLLALP